MQNKKFYCVGNAHLDPLWLWRWQEGSAETKATIRSALDRMKEYPEFVFVCSSAQAFQWIEEFDPSMFEEIKERVKEGRFIIVGGWFVQPDCNSPSGESFARHSLYSQRYFKEKFGVTVKTGYNVDSFGHNAMLPQILKKSGMDNYIFMRPGNHEKELPGQIFRWKSDDGSEILTARISDPYCKNITDTEDMEKHLNITLEHDKANNELPFFYGVGNHGGGPTKKNIEMILEARKNHPEAEFVFSNLSDFFEEVKAKKDTLPVVNDDLQYHAIGCYAAVSAVKNDIRRAECSLTAAENFAMLANVCCEKALPDTKVIENAWKNVMFSHFHDSFGGCSIKSAHDDIFYMLGESRAVAARIENNALQTLSWQINTVDAEKGTPTIVFNPHSFPAEAVVQLRDNPDKTIYDDNGDFVPRQKVHSEARLTAHAPDLIFKASVPAFGYKTYYTKLVENPVEIESPVHAEGNVLENRKYILKFDLHSGYLTSLFDKENELELLKGNGAVPVVIDEYGYDTWAHAKTHFNNEIARFTDAKITVTENGPVRATIKVESFYNSSKLTQWFTLTDNGEPQVKAMIDWREKRKMLKLRFETNLSEPTAYYEIPFGVKSRPCDGAEYPGLSWQALKEENRGIAIINNNKYSFSATNNTMDLTVIRSPYYNDHSGHIDDGEGIFTDQGEHYFSYSVIPFYGEGWNKIIKAARLLNTPPTVIVENNHPGKLSTEASVLNIDAENIVLSAIKQSENGKGLIIRAYETDGKETEALISGSALPVPLKAKFTPYSVNTYYLEKGESQWKEVLLTEM